MTLVHIAIFGPGTFLVGMVALCAIDRRRQRAKTKGAA